MIMKTKLLGHFQESSSNAIVVASIHISITYNFSEANNLASGETRFGNVAGEPKLYSY